MEIDPDVREFCGHIVDWGQRTAGLIDGRSYDQFVGDMALHLAVWKCVEILGEAASRILRIDPTFGERVPTLQLREAYAMRNRLTHGYNDIDLFVLWNTARDFVPGMVAAARSIARNSET